MRSRKVEKAVLRKVQHDPMSFSQTLLVLQMIMMTYKLDVVRVSSFLPIKKGCPRTLVQGTQKKIPGTLLLESMQNQRLKPGGDSGTNVTEIFSTGNYIDKILIENFGEQISTIMLHF